MSKHGHRHRKRRESSYRHSQPGSEPGMLVADPAAPAAEITVFAFNPETVVERTVSDLADIENLKGKWPVLWINVDGTRDVTVVSKVGELFGLHKLALEDVVSNHQRAKVEEYDGYIFVVARMLIEGERLETEQLSLFLGESFVVSFQECAGGDPFSPVRDRIRKGHGRLRSAGADYLAYALIDSVIDHYYPVLEEYGERLDELETQVATRLEPGTVNVLHGIKRDLLTLRRAIWPLRDAINSLLRDGSALVSAETRVFIRDCYDHVVSIIDLIETYRELGSSLMDVYLSSVSNRMNEVMKVLTIISTIFLPATLIAGIYGMNFSPQRSPLNMPELDWYYGYPYALALMVVLTIVTLSMFRVKGWLGGAAAKAAAERSLSSDVPDHGAGSDQSKSE